MYYRWDIWVEVIAAAFILAFHPVSDAPESVRLLASPDKKHLTAGRMEKLECECRGSRPAPNFSWFVGGRQLPSKASVITNAVNEKRTKDSSSRQQQMVMVTTGSVRFVPKPEDNGKYVSCRATNPHYPAITKEDGYIVKVHCEYYLPNSTGAPRAKCHRIILVHMTKNVG